MSILNKVLPLLMILGLIGCRSIENYISPSPPGWEQDVKDLMVEESAFPSGWQVDIGLEVDDYPRNNHAHREFWLIETSDSASQDIYRGYTENDAQRRFDDLMDSQFVPKRQLPPTDFYLPFEPPPEITFQSKEADDFYLACGWWAFAYCQVVARYQNYVVYLRLDHETTYEGHYTNGLTYQQMEKIIEAMDAKISGTVQSYNE